MLLGVLAFLVPSIAFTQDFHKSLTEIQKLKAENFLLKVELVKIRATLQDRENKLASIELTNEQNALVEEYRKELQANKDDVFDWSALNFHPPTKPSK